MFDDSPADDVHLDRPPVLVTEVEIQPAVEPAHADVDDTLGRVEVCLRLYYVERRLQRLRTRSASRCLEEAAGKPSAKALGPDRPGLAMTVDVEVGESRTVWGVEQLG